MYKSLYRSRLRRKIKSKKRFNRRKRIFRKRTTRNRTRVPLGLGFPKTVTMTHRYNDVISLTSTTGVISKQLFACNGMYDPNTTGTGHQPLYFDQMTAIYDHYVVIGSMITIKVMPQSSSSNAAYFGIFIDDDATTSNETDIVRLAEQTSAKFRMIPQGMNNPLVLKSKWSAKKYFGGSILANTELQGTSISNPTEMSYYVLALQADASTTSTMLIDVEVKYIAVWKELRDIAQS